MKIDPDPAEGISNLIFLTGFAWEPHYSFFVLSGIILILLLFLSALISGSEVAFFSLSYSDIEELKENEDGNSVKAVLLLQEPKILLANILILNNLINIGIVTLSTFVTWRIADIYDSDHIDRILLLAILAGSVSFLIVFFGEIIPKVYASQTSKSFAVKATPILFTASKVLKPFAYVLNRLSDLVEKKIDRQAYQVSKEELYQALEITTGEETTEEEKYILKGIVNFNSLTVKQVMKSRMDLVSIDAEASFSEVIKTVFENGYSRIPIFRESIDRLEGMLYIKDLIPYINRNDDFNWLSLIRPIYFVPENKKIESLMRDFQEKRVHVAIVVDEYGGTSGLITLEDIIEEIVGEINDEFDDENIENFKRIDQQTFIFEGKTSLTDFAKVIEVDLEIFDEIKGESESLAGLLLEINSRMPPVGEKIYYDNFVFQVLSGTDRRIEKIKVIIKDGTTQKHNIS
ncbi:MAG: gliding motility-associated protein GldE [Cyclobacteriaceae bacterium]|nr:gliding motility-associated protein GldE [Cyclobacteriaceae bacterium]